MSSVAAPFGLRPTYHPSGTIRPESGVIASGYNVNLFQFAPVALDANGQVTAAATSTADNIRLCGAFMGVEYTPTNGRRVLTNSWPANTVATEIVAYYTRDPMIVYEIQANGPVAVTNIGNAARTTVNDSTAGNTVTGLSNVALDAATLAAAAKPLQVVGIPNYPDNTPGDAFTLVQVRILTHQFLADSTAF